RRCGRPSSIGRPGSSGEGNASYSPIPSNARSTRPASAVEIVTPKARRVLRLTASSILLIPSTGRSAGRAPRSIFATSRAPCAPSAWRAGPDRAPPAGLDPKRPPEDRGSPRVEVQVQDELHDVEAHRGWRQEDVSSICRLQLANRLFLSPDRTDDEGQLQAG